MKKLLVVLLAAMMVLSIAAVSMAAATVEGDWRVEWVQDDTKKAAKQDDLTFNKYDLRFNFKGKVSDTVDAYLQIAFDNSVTSSGAVTGDVWQDTDDDGTVDSGETEYAHKLTSSSGIPLAIKEYKVTFKQSWGTLTAGAWDHKLFPSRVLLKPHGVNCVNAKDMQFVFDVPVSDAVKVMFFMDPDLIKDAMDYDLAVAYNADSWGVEVHYGDSNPAVDKATYYAFDAYYQINDAFKAFLYGIQADDGFSGKWKDKEGKFIDLVPVIGAEYKSGPITTSFEYTLEAKGEGSKDWNQYGLKFAYGFNNKVTLEVEYTNVWDKNEGKDVNKLVLRPRVKF